MAQSLCVLCVLCVFVRVCLFVCVCACACVCVCGSGYTVCMHTQCTLSLITGTLNNWPGYPNDSESISESTSATWTIGLKALDLLDESAKWKSFFLVQSCNSFYKE